MSWITRLSLTELEDGVRSGRYSASHIIASRKVRIRTVADANAAAVRNPSPRQPTRFDDLFASILVFAGKAWIWKDPPCQGWMPREVMR